MDEEIKNDVTDEVEKSVSEENEYIDFDSDTTSESLATDSVKSKNDKKKNCIILILLLLLCILVGLGIWFVWFKGSDPNKGTLPTVAPQIDENAERMEGNDEKMKQPEGGGAVNIMYTKNASVSLGSRKVSMYFGNPSKSNQDMVLQLLVNDKVIAESGRLTPGSQIKTMDVKDVTGLSTGRYNAKYVVGYYYENGEKAIVDTQIPLVISVTK